MKRHVNIEIEKENLITDRIEHLFYKVKGEEKLDYLVKLLKKSIPETAVVFCRTKENVDLAFERLKKEGYSVNKIHGGMLQKIELLLWRVLKGENLEF